MIRRMTADDVMENISGLCALLSDAVDSGASIGFLPPLDPIEALAYWDSVRLAVHDGSCILLAAFEGAELAGSVQLDLCMRANGSHRAEVTKLMVHRAARRKGLGTALMAAVEEAARAAGRSLLVLDTRKGDPSEAVYRGTGYQVAGEIPNYARSANGELRPTVLFYKQIE
ncbi:MAG: GNAT family N-acetyltransferase [Bryobacterales bacterium]|nr:GNAT family N-acetyltransferase [Bryobacterales bacterium]